jgi:hypothetical protein
VSPNRLALPDYITAAAAELERATFATISYIPFDEESRKEVADRYTRAQEAMSAAWRRFYGTQKKESIQ